MARIPGTNLNTLELPPNPPKSDEPCWCTSGIPYERCHLNRQDQIPESRWDILRQMRQMHNMAYCTHPEASLQTCSGDIVRAHTLQRSGALAIICQDRHVYGIVEGDLPDDNGNPRYKRIGINEASTFTGFCGRHDAELFKELETKPFISSKEQLFLLAYRSLAKELYAKRSGMRLMPLLRKGDVGKDTLEQVRLQRELFIHAQLQQQGLDDLESSWADYQAAFLAGDYDRFSAYLVFTSSTPDFAVSGGFSPEFDFQSQALQSLASLEPLDFLSFSVIPFQSGGVIALVWDSKSAQACQQFAASLDRLDNNDIPDALVRFTFEHFENTYANPRWWENLSEDQRKQLLGRLGKSASNQVNRLANCLSDDGLRTATWKVLSKEWR
jgi:hypothetical protein